MEQWGVIVIGAGVVGSAVARELARYRLNVAVLEKELDVACGNSSRNTGMLHAGFTYKPGSLKAECAVEGNKEFDRVAAELGVPFKRTGKLVVGFTDHDMENILKFKAIGEQNGGEIASVTGNTCAKGEAYVTQEIENPMRNIATSVLIDGGELPLASVRLSGMIPKDRIFDVMGEIRKVEMPAPVHESDVAIADVLGLGVDVIVTKDVEAA